MTDLDYSQYDFPNHLWYSLPEWEITVKIVAFVPILAIGLLGNALVFAIILRNRALQTPTNLLLANMSVADFLTLAICPILFMYNNFYQDFRLGKVGCLIEGFIEGALLVTAVFTLCAVSYDRLTAIVLPTETRLTVRGSKIVMVLTWIAGCLLAVPLAIFRFYRERQWRNYLETFCGENQNVLPTYWHILIAAMVWLPLTVMVICYSAILWKLEWYERQALRREHPICVKYKKHVAKTLFLVVLSFVALRCPFTALIFMRNHLLNQQVVNQVYGSFAILWYVSHYLIFVNAAVNPLLYGLTNENFRRAYSQMPFLSFFCPNCLNKNIPRTRPTVAISHSRLFPKLQPRAPCDIGLPSVKQQLAFHKGSGHSTMWIWLNQTRFRGTSMANPDSAASKSTISTHVVNVIHSKDEDDPPSMGTYRQNVDVYM